MIPDRIKEVIFCGNVEEAKKRFPNWFMIKQVGIIYVNGGYQPVLHILLSSLNDKLLDRIYGRRVFTWVSQN